MFQPQFGKSRPSLATGRNELPAILADRTPLGWLPVRGKLSTARCTDEMDHDGEGTILCWLNICLWNLLATCGTSGFQHTEFCRSRTGRALEWLRMPSGVVFSLAVTAEAVSKKRVMTIPTKKQLIRSGRNRLVGVGGICSQISDRENG